MGRRASCNMDPSALRPTCAPTKSKRCGVAAPFRLPTPGPPVPPPSAGTLSTMIVGDERAGRKPVGAARRSASPSAHHDFRGSSRACGYEPPLLTALSSALSPQPGPSRTCGYEPHLRRGIVFGKWPCPQLDDRMLSNYKNEPDKALMVLNTEAGLNHERCNLRTDRQLTASFAILPHTP
jgi:hypothetical protein